MQTTELITHLLAAPEAEWPQWWTAQPHLLTLDLAWALKAHYDAVIDRDPAVAARSATLLTALAAHLQNGEALAVATWTAGMAAMDGGEFEQAHTQLTLAREQFLALGQPAQAAATQLSNFRVLAILGRDEEALQWGEWARQHFEAAGDQLAIGKILLNLGILHFMRDRYGEAERLLRTAYTHYTAAADPGGLIAVENNLATVLTAQYKFAEVETLYQRALARAEAGQYEVDLALLECNWGCWALFQGRFDQALAYLERSQQRYAKLQMAHESAIADQELADAYLELNLAPEAAAIYAQVTPLFAQLGMRTEEARALTNHGRAALLQDQGEVAHQLLKAAELIYRDLDNQVGVALVQLYQAYARFGAGDFTTAAAEAAQTEAVFRDANAWGRLLLARWLRGEAYLRQGESALAQQLLTETWHAAEQYGVPQIAHRALTALGQLALATGDLAGAEAAYKAAIVQIEGLRATLPAERFRIAFLSDKLTPYSELVRLCLADGTPARVAEALGYVERARARALLDLLGEVALTSQAVDDPLTLQLLAQIERLRTELNWFYTQFNRPDSPTALRGPAALAALQVEVQQREATLSDLMRQLQKLPAAHPLHDAPFDLLQLRQQLGTHSVLVEYFSLDQQLLAFVVTDQELAVVDLATSEEQVRTALHQLHFQLGALRYGRAQIARHQATLVSRTQHYLAELYDLLLRPLAATLGERRLVVAPHRTLHYVPFHALYDGQHYVVEAREVTYAPSAAILQRCLTATRYPTQPPLLIGVPDVAAPRIADEIQTLAELFPQAQVLLHEAATRQTLMALAPTTDLLHLACHGRFRADNPLFSALQLSDGWLTVHEAAQLKLQCNLVTLSACETGLNSPAPGDELLGLARGFLLAGAPALLMSLWSVDDSATADFMRHFYTQRQQGVGTAAALRYAQRQLLATHPHPFYWAPFILFGRWT